MKDTYEFAMGYLRKSRGSQTAEERHRTFSNLVLKGELREAVQFVCDREKVWFLQPDGLAKNCTGAINETVALPLELKHLSQNILYCATLYTYEETPIFIPVDITEEAVESVARKF